jgi:hypothetical protein
MSDVIINVTGDVAISTLANANKVVSWCATRFGFKDMTINVILKRESDWWGECGEETEENHYGIMICSKQPLRDFVATIVHEMIHVAQWEKNEWYETDGEKECEELQYKLTDELWKENVL